MSGAQGTANRLPRYLLCALIASGSLALFSALLVAPAPSYDPWMWLLWGRELASGTLSTTDGPAFKPLPVAVCAVLATSGSFAPALWVLLARTGALVALVLSFSIARRLSGGSLGAGVIAVAGVATTGQYLLYAASGMSEGLLLAFALGGAELWRGGHRRGALACAVACGLLRVETWPFLLAAAALVGHRHPPARTWLGAAAVAVPLAWFVPEWIGSGDLLRSGTRARIPNPGQPALADVPALASLTEAVKSVAWPLWAGLVLVPFVRTRSARFWSPLLPAGIGLAWLAVVASMAQGGFSGEPRYAIPGAALIAISGSIGLGRLLGSPLVVESAQQGRRLRLLLGGPSSLHSLAPVLGTAFVVLSLAAGHKSRLVLIPDAQAYQSRLAADLRRAIGAVGGRENVLDCGTPYVGRLRGPLLAYHLGVDKKAVEPDRPPRPPGVAFRSALERGAQLVPQPPPKFRLHSQAGTWSVLVHCGDGDSPLRLIPPIQRPLAPPRQAVLGFPNMTAGVQSKASRNVRGGRRSSGRRSDGLRRPRR